MSRVRDKADFQFSGEDYTHGSGVKYNAHTIQTTDLTASGVITDIHLQDIADVPTVSASVDQYYLKYNHATTSFVWSQVSGGGGGTMNDLVDDTTPQLGGNLLSNGSNIKMADSDEVVFGSNDDANIKHTGSNLNINVNTGDINIRTYDNDKDVIISTDDGVGSISNYFKADGSTGEAILYHYGTEKFKTISTGIEVTGDVNLDSGGVRHTFNVSNSGASAYVFSDTSGIYFPSNANNPTLYLKRGDIYKFSLNASGHPFYIKTAAGSGTGNQYTTGVTGNGTQTGELIFKVPMDAPDTLYYNCSAHSAMGGVINIMGAGGGANTGDISFSGSTISSTGTTVTINDNLSLTGSLASTQAGSPILASATSLTLQAASTSRVHVNQSPLRLYNVSTTNRNAITLADGDLVYDSDINKAYVAQNGSWGQLLTSNGFGYLGAVIEVAGSENTTSGTLTFFANNYQILRLTQDQTADRTLFISGAVGVSFDSSISTGEVRTIAIAWKNGSTPYYINTVQIDGNTQTVKYEGGTAPSAGNASSIDWYTFSIIKTGTAQFEVYGTFAKFA